MKISRAKLRQIIREEVVSLGEAPISKTVDMHQQARRKKRAKSKELEKDFFGTDAGLTEPDTKTAAPSASPKKKAKYRDPDSRWKQYRQPRGSDAAVRGDTVAMAPGEWKKKQQGSTDRDAVEKFFGGDEMNTKSAAAPVDPDKTVARSPEELAAKAAELDAAEPKQATEHPLDHPDRIVITAFDSDVRAKLLDIYASETGIEIDDRPLGHGEFGIVYEGENPEYGPVAVKMTLSGQEINAYKNIKKLKDGLESRDPVAGNALPSILDIRTIVSPPVGPEGSVRAGRYVEKEGGRPYKVFVVQMELLEKLDSETRVDVFGPDPSEEDYSPEVRKRFVEEYLTIENIYSSLEKLFDGIQWEKLVDQVASSSVNEGSLPIRNEKLFPPFREIEKILPRLRKAYLDAPADAQFFALRDVHNILKNVIVKVFTKYVDDESLLERLSNYAGPILQKQMAANARLPQYDPEAIEASPGLRSSILPPSEIQSRVAKNFYNRLKKLEQWDAQYGDVHARNVMQRENGDLVVADVGLFMFGPQGSRGYAASIVERLQFLAGII